MTAAIAKGAATKLTSPDPKLATEAAMAVSTYEYIVAKSVMMFGEAAGITSDSDPQRSRRSDRFYFFRIVFTLKKSASSFPALI